MKRAMFSVIVPVVAFSLSLIAFIPAPAAEAQTVACPAGYTCTPVAPQPVNCPAGFICTSNPIPPAPAPISGGGGSVGGGVVAPTTDATVTVNGSPTLALNYDSGQKESALTATFAFTVHGNTQGVALYQKNGINILFASGKSTQGATQMDITPTSFASSTVDAYGRNTYIVSPGETINFTMTANANPKQMFAGSYAASLQGLYGNPIPAATDGSSVTLNVPSNQSNSVTIIGEVSPYINSVTPNIVSPGQKMSVNGVRLIGAMGRGNLYIDNLAVTAPVDGSKDGTVLFFTIPPLTDGYHSLYVKDNVNGTGASNQVSFQVQSGNSCYLFSTNLTIGSTGADVVALQTWLMGNGFDIPAVSSGKQQKGVYSFQTAAAVAKYQTSIGIPATGFFGPATRAALNASCTPTKPNPISGTQIVASLDPASPVTSTVQISTSAVTANVPLAVFDLKSQGQSANLQSLTLALYTNGKGGLTANQLFSNLQIKVMGRTYVGQAIEAKGYGNLVYFKNITVPLPADQNVPVTVYGTVAANSNGTLDSATAQVSLVANTSNIVALDSNYNTVSIASSGTISGSTITFSSAAGGAQVSNTSATVGAQTCNSVSNPTECDYPVSFSFSLTAGNSPIYVAKTGTCPAGYGCLANPLQFSGDSTQIVMQTASVIPSTGDGSNYYYIAPGQTRQFTYSGVMTNSNNYQSASTYTVFVSSISYGTSASNLSSNSITSGLGNLKMTVQFNGGGTTPPTPVSTALNIGPYDQVVTFTKAFNVNQTGSPVTLAIAADNRFSVNVNGMQVSTNNSETNFYSSQNVDITSAVHQGSNTLAITVDNMADSNNAVPWSSNPGGMIYRITSNGAALASSDGSEQSSVSSTIVIPQNKLLYSWTSIPGANWIWDSSYYNGGTTPQQPAGNYVNLSIDPASPLTSSVQVTNSTINSYLGLPVLVFDLSATGGIPARLSGLTINFNSPPSSAGRGVISAAYLYQGSTLISSASVSNGVTANFANTPTGTAGTSLPINVTVPYTIKADVTGVNSGSFPLVAVVGGVNITDMNGNSLGVAGVANGSQITVVSNTTTSQPPVISGGTFPTTLTVGQTGTWSVSASDPQNGSLSYSVNWGDAGNYVSASTGGFTQTSSFTHSYSSAGTYTVTFTVKNAAGLSAQTSSTINVSAPTPVCPAGYICSVPGGTQGVCPAGYTCTATTANCPSGYACYTQSQTATIKVTATPVVTINGSATPLTINSLPTNQGYSNNSSNHSDAGWPGYYLTLSWTSPGATSCSLTSGTGDIEETDPSPGSKTFSNQNSVQLEDGDTITINCGSASNSVTYHFTSPTSINKATNATAAVGNVSIWDAVQNAVKLYMNTAH
jgi:hypothetical protein